MGTNRRYPYLAGQLGQERELREAAQHGRLQSLSPAQLQLGRMPATLVEGMVWGRAWLRFGDRDVCATVRVGAVTACAVGVEVEIDGRTRRVWVWRGAVVRLARREDGW